MYCLSHILGIIFDILSCEIHIYQEIYYIYLQIMPRINPSHHLQCYHSDSSHCLLSSITAVDSSQVSVLLLLPPAVFSQEKVGCDLLTLEVRLCASSAQISAVTPSSLRTSVTRVLTVAPQILHGLMLMTSLTSSPTTLVILTSRPFL